MEENILQSIDERLQKIQKDLSSFGLTTDSLMELCGIRIFKRGYLGFISIFGLKISDLDQGFFKTIPDEGDREKARELIIICLTNLFHVEKEKLMDPGFRVRDHASKAGLYMGFKQSDISSIELEPEKFEKLKQISEILGKPLDYRLLMILPEYM